MQVLVVLALTVIAQAAPSAVTWKSDAVRQAGEPTAILISTEATARSADQPAPSKRGGTGHKVNIDVQDADIRSVLRLLSNAGGVDFAIGDDVQATIDIQLLDVPWDTALQVILTLEGLQASAGPGGVLVISVADRP